MKPKVLILILFISNETLTVYYFLNPIINYFCAFAGFGLLTTFYGLFKILSYLGKIVFRIALKKK